MSERTLVVSATNVLARGFLVVPTDRTSRSGEPVNGLYAVARAVLHVLGWKVPTRAVAIVDRRRRDWPALLLPQLDALPALLRALGLTVVESQADAPDEPHLVARYVRGAVERGDDVVIVGVDKRYAQLVTESVWWYDSNKDARYTPEIVKKRFGVDPAKVGDWLALVGDDDQVPGVAGIGAKGATGLLEAHDTVEAALEHVTSLEGRARKSLDTARSELPRHLAHARLTAAEPAAAPPFAAPEAASLNAQLDALGFVELLQTTTTAAKVTVCTTPGDVAAALKAMGSALVTLHALIDGDEGRHATIHSVGLSSGHGETYAVTHASEAWPALTQWLRDAAAKKSGHDLIGTMVALEREGVTLAGVVADSACLSHLTQPSGWSPHELPGLARHVLGRTVPDDDEVLGVGAGRKTFGTIDPMLAAKTAGERADASAAITRALLPAVDAALLAEYLALAETLVRLELKGIAVDTAQLDKTEVSFVAIEAELQQQIEALAGHAFNVNSSAQLGKVLFEELKLEVVSHTKTGFSTSNEALERIEHAHPIVSLVLRWRRLRRLRDSWVNTLRKCIHADGRVHSRFSHARSFSGDLINSNPDLGRVPGRTAEMAEIRRAFVAPPGRLLMSVDFSQLGLYVLAHLTRDPALVEPLRQRADMHRLTASAILEKPAEAITLEERQIGKVVNFATFAGQGASSLALQLGVSAAEAKAYIARFDRRYALVRAFQDEQLRFVKERGYLVTLAGRRWPIGGLESLDSQLRSYAERLARRGTHEGSVADVARRALLEADRAIRKAGLDAWPLVEVVDEVLFEVAEAELHESARVCAEAMKHAFELEVPLVVGVEAGKTWADLEPVR